MLRIIYSLSLDITDPTTGNTSQLIVPLDRAGNSPHCRPEPPKQRAIDVRVGDYLLHGGKRHRIDGIRAHREATFGDESLQQLNGQTDGYLLGKTKPG